MTEFFSSGQVADVVLAVMIIEGILLTLAYKRNGRGISPTILWCGLAAGIGLVLALRAALTGASWHWIAAALSASFVAHICDVWLRWSASPRRQRVKIIQ